MGNIRRSIGKLITKAFDLQSLWLQGNEVPWSAGYAGGAAISAAYENSDTAYACIRRKALDISSAPMKFLVSPDNPDREVPPSHPIRRLWNRPHRSFSREETLQFMVTFLELRGECFLMFDDPERPGIIYPWYDPLSWRPEKDSTGEILTWHLSYQVVQRDFFPSELFHHRYVCPTDPMRGQSPLRAASRAYAIGVGGDSLQESLIKRGGERSILYEAPLEYTPSQREQALAALRGRRQVDNTIGRDQLLPVGIKVVDPKFMQDDYDILAALPRSDEKICDVYGVPHSLLSGKEDNYATFRGRLRIYWSNTLVPTIRGLESSFDRYFGLMHGVYIRFDLSKIEALKDNFGDLVEVGVKLYTNHIPWRVINDRLELGLDVDRIPTADTALVNAMLMPADVLIEEANNPPPPPPVVTPPPPIPSGGKGEGVLPLTRSLIMQRARDPRETLARGRRLAALERNTRKAWRELMSETKGKAVKAVHRAGADAGQLHHELSKLQEPTAKAMRLLLGPVHVNAAREGMLSILVLIGKTTWEDERAARETGQPELSPRAKAWIKNRTNLVDGMSKKLFDKVTSAAQRAVVEGVEVSGIADLVAEKFNAASARAATIGRTEVGSAFNVSRFVEMEDQGFEKHEWVTAQDELVRDDPDADHASCDGEVRNIGDLFPCGLAYPMEEGAEAKNSVNCRCLSYPVVGGE